ncbi:MAG TPA: hypothetical protein VIW94_02955 [Acidimicrobiia bacterium]
MSQERNPGAFVVALAIPGALLAGEAVGPIAALAVIALGVVLGWRLVPRFFLTLAAAGFAGAVAGAAIIGVGFRIAMRVVALLEPSRVPEFTIEGTLFIVIMIGGIFGGILGIVASFARRGFGVGRMGGALIAAGLVMGLILIDSETRRELFELGIGGWLNIPMFGLIALGYGYASQWIFDRAEPEVIKDAERMTV